MTWSTTQDYAALRAMLLEDELSYESSTSDAAKAYWEGLAINDSDAPPRQSYFPLAFTAPLPGNAKLRIVVDGQDAFPSFSAISDDRQIQTLLTQEIGRISDQARDEDMPMLHMYTSLQEVMESPEMSENLDKKPDNEADSSGIISSQAPAKDEHGPARLRMKSALLWAHHLLANSKRKDIQHWSTELKVWAIAKIGYPGVMVFEGLEDDVNEFIRRIKALQWYALQVRYEETVEAQQDSSEADLLARCGLARACQPQENLRSKPLAREVQSMSDLSTLMTTSDMREAFAASMKLPG